MLYVCLYRGILWKVYILERQLIEISILGFNFTLKQVN